MSRIHVLSSELADQIAAGEVVERPASVVKELVENSLDAGARRIEVEVWDGGLARLVVSDDGSGMTPEEAHLSLKRHATSKLHKAEDLFCLTTMGFRGEALPSIAAVSQLTLRTRTAADQAAYQIEVRAGSVVESRAAAGPVGTHIEVRNLLSNVPARLKFIKSPATESSHIVEVITRLALSYSDVHFTLRSNDRLVLDWPPHSSGLERAEIALAKNAHKPAKLHLTVREEPTVHVEAYLGSPAEATTTSRAVYPIVNRRFVRDRGLLHAICMGYGALLERGRYPLAVVKIDVDQERIDVNVHPQKLEVRFSHPQEIFAAVRHAIADAVAETPWLAEAAGAPLQSYSREPTPPLIAAQPRPTSEFVTKPSESFRLLSPPPVLPGLGLPERKKEMWVRGDSLPPLRSAEASHAPAIPNAAPANFFASLHYIGQLHKTYLLCEAAGEMVLVDQHAAHERVAFERLRTGHEGRSVRSQRLLLPAEFELDDRSREAATQHRELLDRLGFDLEIGEQLAVRAVPDLLGRTTPAEIVPELLRQLDEDGSTVSLSERTDHLLATVACHSAVRAGQTLSADEVHALFTSLDAIDYRAHCPHGRPVLLRVSLGEIERRFGRV